jgi:hypothetical protein
MRGITTIVRRWERLRLPYNALLGAVTVFLLVSLRDELVFEGPVHTLGAVLVGALLANVCFTAGAVAEASLAWLGLQARAIRPALFAADVLVSLPLVLAFVLGTFGWTIG